MGKTIVITEDIANCVIDELISEAFKQRYTLNSYAVLMVANYLNKHFKKDSITDITSDGKISDIYVGNRIDSHGQVVDQPNLDEITKMLEDEPELRGLISDKKIRSKFFKIVVVAWYGDYIDMQTGIIRGINDFEV